MLLPIAVATLLAADPQVRLASPGLSPAGALKKQVVDFYSEDLAEQLTRRGIRVITSREISALMGLEREKQLLGCAETAASCMAEIGDALGADGVVVGTVAQVGKSYQLNVSVIATRTTERITTFSKRVAREEEVLDAIEAASIAIADAVKEKLKPRGAPVEEKPAQLTPEPAPASAVPMPAPAVSSAPPVYQRPVFWVIVGAVVVAAAAGGTAAYLATRPRGGPEPSLGRVDGN